MSQAHMKAAGMCIVHVAYETTNEAASRLYKSVGFENSFQTVDYDLDLKNTQRRYCRG